VHRLRATYDQQAGTVELRPGSGHGGQARSFSLDGDLAPLDDFLSAFFDRRVHVARNDETGFPDDLVAPGPTVVGTTSLETVCTWFPPLELHEAQRRFRANLEVGGVPAFWEDRLYAAQGTTVRFRIGNVLFEGTNPCQRCVVPSRDPDTGKTISGFQKQFAKQRRATLPAWADP
jgi:uncharacterized protein YcbX